jgi:phosphoserine phosphatase RsbU/P
VNTEQGGNVQQDLEKFELLIVDDEPQILSSLSRQLRVWAQENDLLITTCDNGDTAVEILKSRGDRIAILLSDNRMPGMCGAEIVRHTVELKLPVVSIMLTGYTEKEDVQTVLSSGIFSFLVKPWTKDELFQELRYALQSCHTRRRTFLSARQMREELHAAQEFHRRFFRFEFDPKTYGLEIDYTKSSPGGSGVSGDYLDIVPLDEDSFVILLGDVAGHGLKATFISAILKSMLYPDYIRANQSKDLDPAGVLTWMNTKLTEMTMTMPDMFVTFLVCKVDCSTSEYVFSNAGNPFPVRSSLEGVQDVVIPGIALGVNENAVFHNAVLPFSPDDSLYLFTDGMAPSGMRTAGFDTVSLHAILKESVGDPLDTILSRIKRNANIPGFEDDVTLVRLNLGR